jgi:hypothetical protein
MCVYMYYHDGDRNFWYTLRHISGHFLLCRPQATHMSGHMADGRDNRPDKRGPFAGRSGVASKGIIGGPSSVRWASPTSWFSTPFFFSSPSCPLTRYKTRTIIDHLFYQTYSLIVAGVSQYLTHYKHAHVECGRLRTPPSVLELATLEIVDDYLDNTYFCIPPRTDVGRDGRRWYIGTVVYREKDGVGVE